MNEVVKRTLSGVLYIVILVASILYSNSTFLALFGVFYFTGVFEFSKLYQLKKITSIAISLLFAATLFFFNNSSLNIIYLIVLPFSIYLIYDLLKAQLNQNSRNKWLKYLHLICYVILPFLIITQLPFLQNNYTPFLLISIFILIWCNDTFAYICGRLLGKHKLYEKISPKKTIEGFIGGVFFTLIAAYIINKTQPLNISLFAWLIIALGVSLLGTIGDLIESKYKREAGVKDSGAIMPGHGGILDRLDSILFAAPFLFLIYKLVL